MRFSIIDLDKTSKFNPRLNLLLTTVYLAPICDFIYFIFLENVSLKSYFTVSELSGHTELSDIYIPTQEKHQQTNWLISINYFQLWTVLHLGFSIFSKNQMCFSFETELLNWGICFCSDFESTYYFLFVCSFEEKNCEMRGSSWHCVTANFDVFSRNLVSITQESYRFSVVNNYFLIK